MTAKLPFLVVRSVGQVVEHFKQGGDGIGISLDREFTTEEKRLLAVAAIGTRRRSAVVRFPTDPEEADKRLC